MHLQSTRPQTSDLVVHSFARSLHPELFSFQNECELAGQHFSARIHIFDAGHLIAFVHGTDTIVTELIAGPDQPLPRRKCLFSKRLREHRTESHQVDSRFQYHSSYQLEKMEADVFLSFHEELLTDARTADLAYCFTQESRFGVQPLSVIQADLTNDHISIHTYHTFPGNQAVVKSQSLLEFC